MIVDVTPPNRRPDAEQAPARHREVKKHWRWQSKRRSEETPDKPDDVRLAHLRWRELQRLLRHRYGVVMRPTAEARRDLEILIGYAVLTGKKPQHQVALWAPWLDEDEADHIAAQRPVLRKADDLAERLDLRYCDRQALAITTIGSVDVDQAERERLRCQRRNEAKRQKQAAAAKQEKHTMPSMKPREKVVLAAIGATEIATTSVVEQVKRHRAFRELTSARQEIHRILNRLLDMGLIVDRSEPRPQGSIRYVSRHQQPSR
jgi:hypothetical protein